MNFINKNQRCFFIGLIILILSGIYPAHRFVFEYAWGLKVFYLSVCGWGMYRLMRSGVKKQDKIFIGCLLGFEIALLLSIFFSHYRVRSGSELDIMLCSMAISFLFWQIKKEAFLDSLRFLGIIVVIFLHFSICLTLACFYSQAQFSYPWSALFLGFLLNAANLFDFLTLDTIRNPFDYSNYAGMFAAIVWPFFIGLFLADKRKKLKYVWLLGLVYAFSVLWVSKCKGAWLSSIFILLLLFFIWAKRGVKYLKKYWIIPLCVMSLVFFIVYLNPKTRVILTLLCKGRIKSFCGERWYLAQDGWSLVETSPWTGHGITTTPLHYLKSSPDIVHHCWQLHVAPVQFLIEFGFIGGIFAFLCLGYIIYSGFYILRKNNVPRIDKIVLGGCLLSFFSYLSFMSESSWDIFCISCFFCLIVGFILKLKFVYSDAIKESESKTLFVLLKIISLCLFLIVVFFSVKDVLGRYYFKKFVTCASNKDTNCEFFLKKAIDNDPHNLYYLNHGGYYFSCSGFRKSRDLAQRSISYYEESLKVNPYQPEILESLGALYVCDNALKQGVDCYCKAILCLPHHTMAYVQLLDVLQHFKKYDLYDEWLAFVTFVQPNVVLSQPDLICYLRDNKAIQEKVLNYFDVVENQIDRKLKTDVEWNLERLMREILFGKKSSFDSMLSEKLILEIIISENWLYDIRWKNLLEKAHRCPDLKRHYYVPMKQHSNTNILLHGAGGPFLKISTLKTIKLPSKYLHIYISPILNKHARELLLPLIEKTLKEFE